MKGMKKRVLALVLVIAMILTNAMLVSAEETVQEAGFMLDGYGADIIFTMGDENVTGKDIWSYLETDGRTVAELTDGLWEYTGTPSKPGAAFEGWAKFYPGFDENDNWVYEFQKKTENDPYYTLAEVMNEPFTRETTYAAKWSNIAIEDYYKYYTFDLACYEEDVEFVHLASVYDESTDEYVWEETEGGFGISLLAGQSIENQLENDIRIEKDPVRAGATFEGWAKFEVDQETWKHIFVPKSDSKPYYTTKEMLALDMPGYDVTFAAKWSDIPIEDYYPYYYNVLLDANGGEVKTVFNYSDGTVDKYYEKIQNLGIREGKSLEETLVKDDIEVTGINNAGKVLDSWKVYQAENMQLVGVVEGETAPKSDANQLVTHYDTVIHEANTKADVYVVIEGYKLIDEAMSTEKLFNECKDSNFYAIANWKDSVTVVEDTKVKESLVNEQKAVVDAIAKGTVKETVVSKETAENVKAAVAAGKEINTELVVYPVNETLIDSKEKADILNKVSDELGSGAKVQYLDIQVLLKADDDVLGNINELQSEIAITVAIPKEMKVDGAEYVVIRNHDGKIDVLPATVNADGTVTFKTDKFSTYALAYVGEEKTGTTTGSTSPSTTSPKTGDNNMILGYTLACVAAFAVVVVLKKRNSYVK